jgi:hypothetical protein
MTLSTIGGDLNIIALKQITRWNCYLRGYLHFVFINSIYLSYVLQAGFRLFRIVFHEYKCLRNIRSFFYYIIGQWISSFVFILPILIAREGYSPLIVYLPQDFHCQVPMTSIRGIVFSILSVYFVPLCCIVMIHFWIIIHIRRTNGPLALVIRSIQHKNERDAIIIKRICVIMMVLLLLGIPSSLYVIIFMITGHLHWTSYRVGWMTISISFALISLSSLYVTPQIYRSMRIIFNKSRENEKKRSSSGLTNNIPEVKINAEKLPFIQNMTTGII